MRRLVLPLVAGLWILGVPSLAAAEAPPAGERGQKAGAQQTFEAGGNLYDGKHFQEALVAFRASYQIVPSPNSHLMIARCVRELGHNAEAYREFDAVEHEALAKGDRYESAAHAAAEELAEMKTRVSLLTIHVKEPPDGLVVKIDGSPIDAATLAAPIPLDPATVVVTGEAPGGASGRAEVTLSAGTAPEVSLELSAAPAAQPAPPPPAPVVQAPSPAPSGPPRKWAYVAGGIGVAGVATFAIFGAMSSSRYSSLQSSCPARHCGPGAQSDIDSGKTFQTVANVGLVLGVVGIGVGTTLFLLSHPEKHEQVAARPVHVDVGLGSIQMDGVF